MTAQQAAETLGIDRSLVLKFIRAGRLKAELHGNAYWLEKEEVERFKNLPRAKGWQKGRKRKSEEEVAE